MKLATAKWGVQILAETLEDREILRRLQARLPTHAPSEYAYRTGQVYSLCPEVADDTDGFSAAEIAASTHAIEIRL